MIINATLCYLRRSSHTLMMFRNKKPNDIHEGKWNGLGGKMIPGETPEECAVREIEEESGLKALSLRFRGILTFPAFDDVNDWIVYVFRVDDFTGELRESPEGDLQWIPDHQLLGIPLWEGDRLFLEWLDRPEFFSAKFIYRRGHLVDNNVVFY